MDVPSSSPKPSGTSTVSVVTPEEYTRTDEELLRKGEPMTRAAVLSGSALSIGVSQRDDARCVVRARQLGIPIVKRSTGGLGLWHAPGDVVWSMILSRSDPRVGRDFSRAYRRLGVGPVRLMEERGATAEWIPPRGPEGEYCLLSGRGDVLSVRGLALGGAAQHVTRQALLHHGVLSYRLDRDRLQQLFGLSAPVVDQSLTCLEEVAPGTTSDTWARRLAAILGAGLERV
jgi:lipoate-protein ligase A